MLDHDPVEAGKSIHLRHVDIERDDIGPRKSDSLERLVAVSGEANLEVRLRCKHLSDQLADQGRVVDYQDPDHCLVCRGSLLRTSLPKESRRPSTARVSKSEGSSSSTILPDDSRLITDRTSPSASPVRAGEGLILSGAHRRTSETLSTIRPARCRSVRTTMRRFPARTGEGGMSKRRR